MPFPVLSMEEIPVIPNWIIGCTIACPGLSHPAWLLQKWIGAENSCPSWILLRVPILGKIKQLRAWHR